ncbi:MAG: IS1 family transposase [Chloroflexota bacterium]
MNRLSTEKRAEIIRCLVEGTSINATCRMTSAAKMTVLKLLRDLGEATSRYQDAALRHLPSRRIEADELWSFCHAKARHVPEKYAGQFGYGDVWTWTALDPDTKLMVTWLVGDHSETDADTFLSDLKERVTNRIQLSTDGNLLYSGAVERVFGRDVDYAQVIKDYGIQQSDDASPTARRYSPNVVKSIELRVMMGDPDPDHISTSHVERMNLTIRMGMRRFTRLTNAFSKKVENLAHAVTIQFMFYNFARPIRRSGRTSLLRWRRASAITSGPLTRSPPCSIRLLRSARGTSRLSRNRRHLLRRQPPTLVTVPR